MATIVLIPNARIFAAIRLACLRAYIRLAGQPGAVTRAQALMNRVSRAEHLSSSFGVMTTRGKWFSFFFGFKFILASSVLMLLVVVGLLVAQEMRTSYYQARFFAGLASKASYTVAAGPSPTIRFPQSAPYDDRLGYAQLPAYISKLRFRDFEIVKQARISEDMAKIVDAGYFAPYSEKNQSGLSILDRHNDSLFQERYPKRIFQRFDDVAPILEIGRAHV